MDLSIIIPSFKREELLRWGLTSLSLQKVYSKFEVIVLNEGIEDGTEEVCKKFKDKLDIKYLFTGKRNTSELKWRVPGFAINIGAKQASGRNIIISCPEIYLIEEDIIQQYINILNSIPKALVITNGKDDADSVFLNNLNDNSKISLSEMYDLSARMSFLNTKFPFFLGVNRKEFVNIGGYDEDFVGYCWDDKDIVDRLVWNGGHYYKVDGRIVHLFHSRVLRPGVGEKQKEWLYNQSLYNQKINQIVRNKDKAWGVL